MLIGMGKHSLIFVAIFLWSASCSFDSNNSIENQSFNVSSCSCDHEHALNTDIWFCDTLILSDQSILYWRYNCDRIWLTLENRNGQRIVVDDLPAESMPILHRIGAFLVKEFDETLLFQRDCAATGTCFYFLVEKNTGSVVREFPQLIGIDWEMKSYTFDFVAYLSEESDEIHIYFPNESRTCSVPISDLNRQTAYPEFSFTEMTLFKEVLTLKYTSNSNKEIELFIDMNQVFESSKTE